MVKNHYMIGDNYMRELSDEKLKYKLDKIYKDLIRLKRLNIENNYCTNLLIWFDEVILKNIAIFKSKQSETETDQELFKKPRQNVYWIDFGRNIGSEFRDLHFAVVIYESKYTALVVPLTSKKEQDPKWIADNRNVIVDLGIIEGFPEDSKECYACTFMIQSVSKKRLSRYGNQEKGFYDIKLTNEQMKRICNNLSQIAYNSIEKENNIDIDVNV